MRFQILFATLFLTLLAVAAAAQPPAGGPPDGMGGMRHQRGLMGWERISQFDEDGDGVVSRGELERGFDLFARLDSDGDGVLTEADFAGRGRTRERSLRMRGAAGGRFLLAADADNNGEITQGEWLEFLAQADSDGDGVVDNLPFGHRQPPEGASQDTIGRFQQLLDRDGNGQLETSDLEAIFAEHDKNGDGTLTHDELRRRRQRGPGGGAGG